MQRETFTNGRVFPVDELDGFYVGDRLCVHITFEDEESIVIDVFDTALAAFRDVGNVIAPPVILNLRTGKVRKS